MELATRLVEVFDRLGDKSVKPLTVQDVYGYMDLGGRFTICISKGGSRRD